MTNEQRIAEIRAQNNEHLHLIKLGAPFVRSPTKAQVGDVAFLLKQLDTLAAECLRLRDLMLQIGQALDAAKEAK